jgi:hypothetical protein
MTRYVWPFFVALVPAMLWCFLLAPLLLRRLGVPFPLKWRERKHLHLSLNQNVRFLSGLPARDDGQSE